MHVSGRGQVLLAFMPAVHAGIGYLLRAGLAVHHINPLAARCIAAAALGGLMLSLSLCFRRLLSLWSALIIVRLL